MTPGATPASTRATARDLAAAGLLTRLALRRDRVVVPVTAVVVVLMVWATVASLSNAYPSLPERRQLQATAATNSAFLALLGPFEHPESVASTTTWRIGLFMVLVLGVLAVLAVVRHTRKEEEAGRLELVRAAPVGPLAPLVAGLVVGVVLSVLTAVLVTLVLLPQADGDTAGCVAAGAQYLALGLASCGIGAVCAQVATTSRTASTLGTVVLVAGYALRGAGDVEPGLRWLRRVSPVGWAQQMDPFGANAYGPFLLCVALFVVGAAAAAALVLHRDLGAGLVAPRPGPAGSASLGSPAALVTRLQGPAVATWSLTAGAYCLLVGFLLRSVDAIVGDNPAAQDLIDRIGGTGALQDVFVSVVMSFVGIAAAAFGVTVATQLRGEEVKGRTEAVLATATSRARYLGAYAALVVGGVVVLLAACGLLMALGHALTGGGWGESFATEVAAAAVQAPAALVVGGFALALYAWWPRLVVLGWAVVALIVLLVFVGDALGLPQWVLDVSPFTHVPRVPVDPVRRLPLGVLLAVAVALGALAFAGFRRREIRSA